jgi:phosphosulfolactate synthase
MQSQFHRAGRPSAFPSIEAYTSWPRSDDTGLTMMIDWGLGRARQADLMALAGGYVHLAKIAVGLAGLIPLPVLREKLANYVKHGIQAFPGGQYLEYAVHIGKVGNFFQEARAAGFMLVEVSDNTQPFSAAFKQGLFRQAVEEFGLRVLGEVGSKVQVTDIDALRRDVENCLSAGAWKVFVEAAEFFVDGRMRMELVDMLAKSLPLDALIFELPGWWLGSLATEQVPMMRALIDRFGPTVNLGNVGADQLLFTETLRRKTGVAGFKLEPGH